MRTRILSALLAFTIIMIACDDKPTRPVPDTGIDTLAFVDSPAEDYEAELAAVALSRQLLAPQWLYDRIHHDLNKLRETFSDSVPAVNLPYLHWGIPGRFSAYVDSLILNISDSSTLMLVDSICDANDITFTYDPARKHRWGFASEKRYHPYEMINLFTGVPGITRMYTDWARLGEYSEMSILREGSVFKYFMDQGWGDCPAGCTSHRYHYFRTTDSQIVHVESTPEPGTIEPGWTPPTWIDSLEIGMCMKFLNVTWTADGGWIAPPPDCDEPR